MVHHGHRSKYCIIGSHGNPRPHVSLSCPAHAAATPTSDAAAEDASAPANESNFLFGWMFGEPENPYAEDPATEQKLINLGRQMMALPVKPDNPNGIPSGYTYLGQFLAHEITFDKTLPTTPGIAAQLPADFRSPQIDLDSLYGVNPKKSPDLYVDGVRLKIGQTYGDPRPLPNDLPRDANKVALLADERNDDNLAVAQTHVAFIRFHNKIVDALEAEYPDKKTLFRAARKEVVRHFQWIILHDYLPRIVDKRVLASVVAQNRTAWKEPGKELFMPLEFAAAGFRIGHSMVRLEYDWNLKHGRSLASSPAGLADLFDHTERSGNLHGNPRLATDWVIDWRRFYDFTELGKPAPAGNFNVARPIDTSFELRLNVVTTFRHENLPVDEQSIAVRNLRCGYRVQLPPGEEVAERMKKAPLTQEEVVLTHDEIVKDNPLKDLLADPVFKGRTPLWYYILREAEIEAERHGVSSLGPVGSRIVAETLVGLIRESRHSILDNWTPERFGRSTGLAGPKQFDMIDLLDFAFDGNVNPLG